MWEDYAKKLKYYLSQLPDGSYETIYYNLLFLMKEFEEHKDKRIFRLLDNVLAGPPTAESFNDLVERFKTDFSVLDRMTDKTDLVTSHNTTTAVFDTITNRISKVKDKLLEISSLKSQRTRYIACDTFTDLSKIDTTAVSTNNSCAIDTTHGLVTLRRVSSKDLKDKIETIVVDQATTAKRPLRSTTTDVANGSGIEMFYEGQYYAPIGQAFPEGGGWRFKVDTTNTIPFENRTIQYSGAVEDLSLIPTRYARSGNSLVVTINNINKGLPPTGKYVTGGTTVASLTFQDNSDGLTVRELLLRESGIVDYRGFKVTDDLPSEQELSNVRQLMIDGNPLTYWQCETTRIANTTNTTNTTNTGNINQTSNISSKIDVPIKDNTDPETGLLFTPIPLSVSLTFTLSARTSLNWITIHPYNFPKLYDENTPIHITNIEYSELGTDDWKQIPEFNYLILTDRVNQILDDYTLGVIMEENRYAFKGKGVWSFETISAKKIKITITQPRPYKITYQNYNIQLASQTNTSTSSIIKSTGRTILIELPYLNTVAICEGSIALETQTPESGPTSSSTSRSKQSSGFLGFGASFSSSTSSFSDTGLYLVNKWLKTNDTPFDRYAIGIREISICSYSFSNNSELITQTFTVPETIGELEIEAYDSIPNSFDTETRWIKYFLTIDGNTWIEISPINKTYTGLPTRLRVGNTTALSYEKLLPDTKSNAVKLKIVMSRPSDNVTESPKLLGYKIIAYPKE